MVRAADLYLVQDAGSDSRYLNRELSWLDFNYRVLRLAGDPDLPVLERLKFLAIFSQNIDEFFQVRVAGLKDQVAAGVSAKSADGLDPRQQLLAIARVADRLLADHARCFTHDVAPALSTAGVDLCDYADLTEAESRRLAAVFETQIFPVLTPLAVDPGHPFPYIEPVAEPRCVGARSDRRRNALRAHQGAVGHSAFHCPRRRQALRGARTGHRRELARNVSRHGHRVASLVPGHPQRRPGARRGGGRRPARGHRGGAASPPVQQCRGTARRPDHARRLRRATQARARTRRHRRLPHPRPARSQRPVGTHRDRAARAQGRTLAARDTGTARAFRRRADELLPGTARPRRTRASPLRQLCQFG